MSDESVDRKEELKAIPYSESIEHLSGLNFETAALVDDELPASVAIAIHTVAVVYNKSNGEVIEDLTEKRMQEAEDVRADNELRYGHLNQDGSNPHHPDPDAD